MSQFGHGCIYDVIDLYEFNSLVKINCEYNKITKIINICPTVKYLNCKNNLINQFECLPDDLETLICDDNKISNLNNLHCGLKFLSCGSNPIVNLDYLPAGLTKLFLIGEMKKLISLNDLPNSI